MLRRIDIEEREARILSAYACLSRDSKGRQREDKLCDIRTIFQQDRDRIIHSKAFRRLKHKTQVFLIPEGDHYRTRLTHTLEVAQIARTIARALVLNEDLTEAIALGHDLGHTPFGHAGEKALNEVCKAGFKHNEQSLRVVDIIEDLNLSYEVRDGILNHTGQQAPATLEGQIVKIADRIAYINHDIDDAIRAGIISLKDIPAHLLDILGETHSDRVDRMVRDIIENSWGKDRIERSPEVEKATEELRAFLYENVYIDSLAKKEEDKAIKLVKSLFEYYMENPAEITFGECSPAEREQLVVDYIAGMTDTYAVNKWKELILPLPWKESI
ncbi:MAG: deoxyguanosinetriphosphate triphosphohydrolase [Halanaerobiales bacterium]